MPQSRACWTVANLCSALEVAGFEQEFAAYCGTTECIALNSGTSALHLALLAAGVGAGDEVITVPFTFVASVAAIIYAGARPVLVDIDPRSFTMDPAAVEAAITPRTKAILPVHLYGQPADMDPIMEVARRHGLVVIEDAAQAHGAKYKGRAVGSIGDLACFSFYPGKNLGAYGEGGAVTTSNEKYAQTVRMLRDWGQDRKYHHVLRGYNYRMEGFQGAVLRETATLKRLGEAFQIAFAPAGGVRPTRAPRRFRHPTQSHPDDPRRSFRMKDPRSSTEPAATAHQRSSKARRSGRGHCLCRHGHCRRRRGRIKSCRPRGNPRHAEISTAKLRVESRAADDAARSPPLAARSDGRPSR